MIADIGACHICSRFVDIAEFPLQFKEQQNRYYMTRQCRACRRERQKAYFATARGKTAKLEGQARYRMSERGQTILHRYLARPEAKEKRRLAEGRRRATQRGLPHTLTHEEWRSIKLFYGDRCAYCGAAGPLHMDHVVPIARGGPHSKENVVPACSTCNHRKHAKSLEELGWRLLLADADATGTRTPYLHEAVG